MDRPSLAASQGSTPAGFDATGEPIDQLDGFPCDADLYTVDVNGDGKVDLLVRAGCDNDGTQMIPLATYSWLTRVSADDDLGGVRHHSSPSCPPAGSVVFLDVNGDGLPDAVESGQMDHMLWTWLNTGPTFAVTPHRSLPSSLQPDCHRRDQDTFFNLAAPIDYNGDGWQDLLMPRPRGHAAGPVRHRPGLGHPPGDRRRSGPTFTLADPHIPFEP